MDFDLSEEQSILRDTVASYLADNYAMEVRRAVIGQEPGWRPEIWKAFAEELGILGAPFSEDLGGLGGGPIENMIVMEELGKALVDGIVVRQIARDGVTQHRLFFGEAEIHGGSSTPGPKAEGLRSEG